MKIISRLILIIFSGFAAGILSSMGIGGGIILVPILVYFFHTSQITAQGVIMTIFLPTAAIALYTHYKNGYLKLNLTFFLACGALFGAIIGAILANNLPNTFLSKIFGIFLLITGLTQILPSNPSN